MRKRLVTTCLFLSMMFAFTLLCRTAPAWAAAKVITVPVTSGDITTPHLAYNGHTTTFKAIARGFSGIAQAQSARFSWDFNGDGIYDRESVPAQCVSAPEGTTCYDLSAKFTYPPQSVSTTFQAKVRLSVSGQDTFAVYPVFVRADVPAASGGSATILPQNATDEQLEVMRAVALDESLWYLHLHLSNRGGTGAAIYGYPDSFTGQLDNVLATTGGALLLLGAITTTSTRDRHALSHLRAPLPPTTMPAITTIPMPKMR